MYTPIQYWYSNWQLETMCYVSPILSGVMITITWRSMSTVELKTA